MSQSSTRSTIPAEIPPLVRWRSWPLRAHPVLAAMLIWGWVALVVTLHQVTGQPFMAVVAGLALALSLWRFFVPVVFELNLEGVHQWSLGRHRRLAWKSIGHYELQKDGALLLPFADWCPLDALRGLYLPWGTHREEVLANLRYHLSRLSPPGTGG